MVIVVVATTSNVCEQTVAHGAAGRADSETRFVRRGPVNGTL